MLRVLVGSPVRQEPSILRYFLRSLSALRSPGLKLDFCFVDDNVVSESSALLVQFAKEHATTTLLSGDRDIASDYSQNGVTHRWTDEATWRVARYKNSILNLGRKHNYDYVFLVDSDLVLHPRTLERLVKASKHVVSEVFWTRWQPESRELPQVWVSGQYELFERDRAEQLAQNRIDERIRAFLAKLREPGLYRVGGLGACTLISHSALTAGVSFDEIPNVPFWGEDRHFCIRAASLGLELWVDTHFPAYHIYRASDLDGVEAFMALANSEQDAMNVSRAVVELYGSTLPDDQTEQKARVLLEPDLAHQFLSVYEAPKQGVGNRTEVVLSRVEVRSLDARYGLARVVVWFTNRGLVENEHFEDELVAQVNLRWGGGRWLAQSVHFIPLPPSDAAPQAEAQSTSLPTSGARERVRSTGKVTLALAMVVRNEAHRYLPSVLEEARHYIDAAAIIDDASSDDTVDVCKRILADIPTVIHCNTESQFHNEHILRRSLWDLAGSLNPEWILVLDADEVLEKRARSELRLLLEATDVYYWAFRLYDFWDDEHYREDRWWHAHRVYRPLLLRFIPGFEYRWKETPQHCGRVPLNVANLRGRRSDLRVKHFGWARLEDRVKKYERYLELDPEGRYGILEQYLSILDPTPRLVEWEEEPRPPSGLSGAPLFGGGSHEGTQGGVPMSSQ